MEIWPIHLNFIYSVTLVSVGPESMDLTHCGCPWDARVHFKSIFKIKKPLKNCFSYIVWWISQPPSLFLALKAQLPGFAEVSCFSQGSVRMNCLRMHSKEHKPGSIEVHLDLAFLIPISHSAHYAQLPWMTHSITASPSPAYCSPSCMPTVALSRELEPDMHPSYIP